MVPLDLGAKGSCQIGGNIATNAGETWGLSMGGRWVDYLLARCIGCRGMTSIRLMIG